MQPELGELVELQEELFGAISGTYNYRRYISPIEIVGQRG